MRTKKVGKNEAVLAWDQLPVDEQNGFIRNYTIFYKTSAGNETGEAPGWVRFRLPSSSSCCCPPGGRGSLRQTWGAPRPPPSRSCRG